MLLSRKGRRVLVLSLQYGTILSCCIVCHNMADAQKFEPYQSNGGLVSAVAGKDFCVVACDTRLTDGGYGIYSRRHVQSRLWGIGGSAIEDDEDDSNSIFQLDGSVQVPSSSDATSPQQQRLGDIPKIKLRPSPTLIASAGCNADCEGLKRVVRAELRAAEYFKGPLSVDQVANTLSQVLYQRRGFPWYAFCVVGGLTAQGEGAAYVYDFLGLCERVAVATSGTGRELLQPILDRQFRTWQRPLQQSKQQQQLLPSSPEIESDESGDEGLVIKKRPMPAVVGKQVSCTVDEAVSILINAYRSVSEREIGVGDSIVLCITERDENGGTTCRVLAIPLKEH